jgi:hypothetical protein
MYGMEQVKLEPQDQGTNGITRLNSFSRQATGEGKGRLSTQRRLGREEQSSIRLGSATDVTLGFG